MSLSIPFTCAGMKFANVRSNDLQVSAKSTAPQIPVFPLRPQNGDQGAKGHGGLLTRDGLAQAIADRCEGLSLAKARHLVDNVPDQIVDALSRGQTLKLQDVWTFSICLKGKRGNFRFRAKAALRAERKKTRSMAPRKLKRPVNQKAPLQMGADSRIARPSEIDLELRERIQAVRRWRMNSTPLSSDRESRT